MSATAPVGAAIAAMAAAHQAARQTPTTAALERANCVIVIDEQQFPVGTLSGGDVLCWHTTSDPWQQKTLAEVMTSVIPPLPRREDFNPSCLLAEMAQAGVRYLPVVDCQGRAVGLVSPLTLQQHLSCQSLQQQEILQTLTQGIQSAPDLTTALQLVVQELCAPGQWSWGEVWIPVVEEQTLTFAAAYYPSHTAATAQSAYERLVAVNRQQSFAWGEGLPGRVWAQQTPEWLPDLQHISPQICLRRDPVLQAGLRAALGVPIFSVDGIEAVLVLFTHQQGPEVMDEATLAGVAALGNQLGSVIQRKRLTLAIAQREQTTQALLKVLPDMLLRVDRQGHYRELMSAGDALPMLPPEGHVASIANALPPALAQQQIAAVQRAIATGTLQRYEQVVTWEHTQRHEEVRIVPLGADEALIIVRDVTDLKQVERELAQRNRATKAILRAIPDLLLRLNQAGDCLETLSAGEVVNAATAADQVRPLQARLPPPLTQQKLAAIHQAIATNTVQTYRQTLTVQGVPQHEEVRVVPYSDTEVLVIVRDMSEQRQAETALQQLTADLEARVQQRTQALQASEARYRAVVEDQTDLICRFDADGVISFVNDAYCRYFGVDRATYIGQSFWPLIPEGNRDRVRQNLRSLSPQSPTSTAEQQVQLHNGEVRWQMWTDRAIFDAVGNVLEYQAVGRDITDQKKAEQVLQATMRELDRFFSVALDLLCILDGQGHFYRLNQAWQDTLGYGLDTLVGTPLLALVHPDDRPETEALLTAALTQSPTVQGCVNRCRCQDGSYRWVEWRLTAADGLLYAAARDITQRKQVEEELRSKTTHLATAQRIAHIGSGELEVATGKAHISEEACRMYGFDPSQRFTTFEHLLTCTHPEDRTFLAQHFRERLAQQAPIEVQYRIQHPTLGVRYIQANGEPVVDYRGRVNRYVGTALDITDRIHYEHHLQELSDRLRLAMRTSGVGICDWCFEENQVCWDEALYSLYGMPPNQPLTFQDWMHCLHPDDRDRTAATLQRLQDPEVDTITCEFRILRPDGEIKYVEATAHMRRDGEGRPLRVIGTNLDITQRKKVEVHLRRINAEVLEAARLKDEFLANMSHELRTPLNAILGMAEALQEQVYGALTPGQHKSIATIERSGRHLLELINDILDLSKIGAGKLDLHITTASIRSLCKHSLAFVQTLADKKNIRLLPPDLTNLPRTCQADERRLRQVLINLLTNAIKFTEPGGQVAMAVTYRQGGPLAADHHGDEAAQPKHIPEDSLKHVPEDCLDHVPDGDMNGPAHGSAFPATLSFAITDTGIGIAPTDVDRLFEPFTQVDSRLNRRQEGTGLGLALVQKLVQLHGGTVTVQSQIGQGSCFTVQIPCPAQVEAFPLTLGQGHVNPGLGDGATLGNPQDAVDSVAAPAPTATNLAPLVLLAEDNDANADTIVEYLVVKGYRLVRVTHGRAAIAAAQTHRPDVILMDVQMPDMDGLEAMGHIRQDPALQSIPIIALTALAMPGDEARCRAAGANGYLAKPLRLRQLMVMLQTMLMKTEAGGYG